MRIGILTGGGDVPGLNPCIKTVVNRADDAGMTVVGIRHGWGGLLNFNPDDPEGSASNVEPLSRRYVRTIDRYGGTHLHTSRTNPARVKESAMPEFLKGVARALPLTYLSDALRQTMVGGTPFSPLWVCFAVLAGFLVICFAISARFFRWS